MEPMWISPRSRAIRASDTEEKKRPVPAALSGMSFVRW
jgi:hypothetical protein